MAKITIPYSAEIGTDKTPAEEVNQSFFSTKTPHEAPNSGSALNGTLDEDNLGTVLTYSDFKQGAFSSGGSIGATDNLDFFPEIFPSGTFITGFRAFAKPCLYPLFPNKIDFFQPIPGANQTFYSPYNKALVIFTWNISIATDGWVNQSVTTTDGSESADNGLGAWVIFKLFHPDGTETSTGVQKTETAYRTVVTKRDRPTSASRRGAQEDLYYSGHLMYVLDQKGWHTGGLHLGYAAPRKVLADNKLYIYALDASEMPALGTNQEPHWYETLETSIGEEFVIWDEGVRQARVRVRSLRHVLFRL